MIRTRRQRAVSANGDRSAHVALDVPANSQCHALVGAQGTDETHGGGISRGRDRHHCLIRTDNRIEDRSPRRKHQREVSTVASTSPDGQDTASLKTSRLGRCRDVHVERQKLPAGAVCGRALCRSSRDYRKHQGDSPE
jgi:hypothetical protein